MTPHDMNLTGIRKARTPSMLHSHNSEGHVCGMSAASRGLSFQDPSGETTGRRIRSVGNRTFGSTRPFWGCLRPLLQGVLEPRKRLRSLLRALR